LSGVPTKHTFNKSCRYYTPPQQPTLSLVSLTPHKFATPQFIITDCTKEFEQVKSFKYLGSIAKTDNTMEEEIKEKIVLGNKVYFANKKMFQSRLISKRAKLTL
jgi:hypothetical protein